MLRPLAMAAALLGLWYPLWAWRGAQDPGRLLEGAGARVIGMHCYAVGNGSGSPPAVGAPPVQAGPGPGARSGCGAPDAGIRTFRTAYGTLAGPPPGGPLALARFLAARAGVVVVEEMADGNLASVAGYGPGWGPALRSPRGYVNLQVGVRYDPGTDSTRVAVGTPAVFPDF